MGLFFCLHCSRSAQTRFILIKSINGRLWLDSSCFPRWLLSKRVMQQRCECVTRHSRNTPNKRRVLMSSPDYYSLNVTLVVSERVRSSLAQASRYYFPDVGLVLRSKSTCLAFANLHRFEVFPPLQRLSSGMFCCRQGDQSIFDSFSLRTFVKAKIWPHLRFGPFRRLENLPVLSLPSVISSHSENSVASRAARACTRLDRIYREFSKS